MSDDTAPRTAQSEPSAVRSRRQILQYLAAGALGGATAVGLDHALGTDGDTTDSASEQERMYDIAVYETDTGYEAVSSGGETVNSGSDGWAILESGIRAAPDSGSVYVEGQYQSESTIEVAKSLTVYGDEATIEHRHAGDFVFRFQGEERYETTLAEEVTTGSNSIRLADTSEIEKGDMVLLAEESGAPVLGRGQPPGEPHSVLGVDGRVVRLEDSVVWRDGYPSGTLVYVLDPITVHLSGFDLSAPAKDENYYGVMASQCRDSTFEGLWMDKFGSRAILLEACANVRVRDCTVLQSSDIEASDGYGIQLWAGCHDVIVEGCVAKECRHPVSVTSGGDRQVPSRTVIVRDCFVTSDGAGALNCHGGAAHDIRFEGCTVHTWGESGVVTGAQRTSVAGCEFRLDGNNAVDTRGDGQERIVTVTDTDIFGATNAIKLSQEEDWNYAPLWKLVHLEGVRAYGCNRFFSLGGGQIDRVRDLLLRGCYWDEVDEEGIRLLNQLDGGIIQGNNFGNAPDQPHILARGDPDNVIRNLQISGNTFTQGNGDRAFVRLAHGHRCVVSNNRFETESTVLMYVDGPSSTGNLITQNAYYAPDPPTDTIMINEGSVATDNHVYETSAGRWR
ncbi:right-handed parallel beta-helix repeat-containing protein [Haloarcula marina]|uniref:right-handed parallel beta-helix repeat-containing protein n=1 Tax=Haloarcula marina TaxID=2961574 RepID=UPI0020B6F4E0|nr:right-handed parallel beta-helix repeat-containing protein [Halomicroarcula marina]